MDEPASPLVSPELSTPSQISASLSDDEQYDNAFPLHPLSRLRAYLRQIEATLQVDDDLAQTKPFRIKPEVGSI
jgi:hypothetical protein